MGHGTGSAGAVWGSGPRPAGFAEDTEGRGGAAKGPYHSLPTVVGPGDPGQVGVGRRAGWSRPPLRELKMGQGVEGLRDTSSEDVGG